MDAALRVMGRVGYASTTTAMVAQEAGVTRGAVYGHFGSKPALYAHLLSLSQAPLTATVDAAVADSEDGRPAPGAVYRFMVRWLALLHTDPRHRASTEIFLNKSEMVPELDEARAGELALTRHILAGLRKILRRGVQRGELAEDLSVELTAVAVYAHLMGLMQTWLFNPRLFNLRRAAPELVHDFLNGSVRPTAAGRRALEEAHRAEAAV